MSKQYWLCCGSLCPEHKDSRGQKCREAATGHPERCRFGTSEDHGEWDRAQKESAYVSINRDELKRLQKDAEQFRKLRSFVFIDLDSSGAEYVAIDLPRVGSSDFIRFNELDLALEAALLATQGDSHE